MRPAFRVFLFLGSLMFVPEATAVGLDDLLRQGGNVVVDTQRSKTTSDIESERRKREIDIEAQRQIASSQTIIDANIQRIDQELDTELVDTRVELRALERDLARGAVSRPQYANEKRVLESRENELRRLITNLKEQNLQHKKRQEEIITNADSQKKQVDVNAAANNEQATTRQNSNILEQIIRSIGR